MECKSGSDEELNFMSRYLSSTILECKREIWKEYKRNICKSKSLRNLIRLMTFKS